MREAAARADFDALVAEVRQKTVAIEGVILVTHAEDGEVSVEMTGDHLGRTGATWGGGVGLAVGLVAPALLATTVATGGVVGWLTGKFRAGRAQPETSRGAAQPGRYEIGDPGNAEKLQAVEALALLAEEAGLSLVHLALAFVLEHPAVTAPIIGPRTFEQLQGQLGAAALRLPPDVLDEIDKIVPPGVTVSSRDTGYQPPSITDAARRRRG